MAERIPIKAHELIPPLKVTRITDQVGLDLLKDFFARVRSEQSGVIGWDIETDPKRDFFFRRCRTIQFGNQKEQYVIDLLAFCPGFSPGQLTPSEQLHDVQGHYGKNLHLVPGLQNVLETIRPVVCSRDFLKVGVNLGFEYMSFYWLFGMRTFHFFDCSVVEKCIWAGAHSLKDYGFFGMEEMMDRYFKVLIDKALQTSFTLEGELSDEQIAYAALDTRFPIALKAAQTLILQAQTTKGLQAKGNLAWKVLANVDPVVTGDNLLEIAQIENDTIGSFQDMHVHGERIDRARWFTRTKVKKAELKALIADILDPIFLPIVGSKLDTITDAQIEGAAEKWKSYNIASDQEIQLKAAHRVAKKSDPAKVPEIEAEMARLAVLRKDEKEYWKSLASDLGKKRTKIKNLAAKCEGEALINYGSDAQLLKVLQGMKGLHKLTSLDDEVLEKYEHIAVMAAIRKYHGLAKEIGTYGDQWALEWMTKPCKEEGWLNPGDGRLHCVFNQYDAETGRSSSEKPNGQNLPQDKEIRSCFTADVPDPSIRVSNCCEADAMDSGHVADPLLSGYYCAACNLPCDTHAEEYTLITCDMSGAELRIIAERANDPIWIGAFSRGEDVHSVGTEILQGEAWAKGTLASIAKPDGWTLQDCKNEVVLTRIEDGKEKKYGPCAYYALKANGEPERLKCKCPEHAELRNATKAINFLLAYGGGPSKLAASIKKKVEEAKKLMAIHAAKFPRIWAYLEESGRNAKIRMKSFDMFGRRRLFPKPTQEAAKQKAMEDREEQLRLEEDEAQRNVETFMSLHKRKPTKEESWFLTHRMPSQKEINNAFLAMHGGVERQGKNHCIQSANATIAKLAMSCGYDKDGKPYLWHIFPQYGARLIKFVHDELVVNCPKRHAAKVAAEIQDAFRRAAATKMTRVVMESEFKISEVWEK